LHKSERMFGDHIARAMAHERQRDIVPELRRPKSERSRFGVRDGRTGGASAASPGSESDTEAPSRVGRPRVLRRYKARIPATWFR